MEIVYQQETNDRWSAEIDLHKLYGSNVTGGVIYAYGDTKDGAKKHLIECIETFKAHLTNFVDELPR